jgi:pyridoxine kinase
MPERLTVLSIQSEVVRGHVGNSAARFALQCLGLDVWAVPTVVLSNHPGHGKFRGEALSAKTIDQLIAGLGDHGWLSDCDAVLSGYLGAAEQARAVADAVRKVKTANANAIYLLDPVFGDDGGAYARPGVAEAMARDLLPLADIVTPNRFELASLTSRKVADAADALAAARTLGKREVVVTSVPFPGGRVGTVVAAEGGAWANSAPRLEGAPNGSGDLLAALYLGARLVKAAPAEALARASSAVDGVLKASVAARADELLLVALQGELRASSHLLAVERLTRG